MLALITFSIIPFFFLCFLFLVVGYGVAFFLVPRKETSVGNTDNYRSNLSEIEKKIHTAINNSSGSNPNIDSELEVLKTQHAGEIQEKDKYLLEKDNEIIRQDKTITEKNEEIKELKRQIQELESQEKSVGKSAAETGSKISKVLEKIQAKKAKDNISFGLSNFLNKSTTLTSEQKQQVYKLDSLCKFYKKNKNIFVQTSIYIENITQKVEGRSEPFSSYTHIDQAIKQVCNKMREFRQKRYLSDEFAMKFKLDDAQDAIHFCKRIEYFEMFKELQDVNGKNHNSQYNTLIDTYKNLPLDASDESILEAIQNIRQQGLILKSSIHGNHAEEETAPIARTTSGSVFPEPRTKKQILSLIQKTPGVFEHLQNQDIQTSDVSFLYHVWHSHKMITSEDKHSLQNLIDKYCKEKSIQIYDNGGSVHGNKVEVDLRGKYELFLERNPTKLTIDWPVYCLEKVNYPHVESSEEKKKGKAICSIIDSFVVYVLSLVPEFDFLGDCEPAKERLKEFKGREFSEDTWFDLLNCFYRCWSTFRREYFKTEDVRYLKLDEVPKHIISFTKREFDIQLHAHIPYKSNFWNEKDAERVEKLGRDELSSSYFDDENPPIGSIEEIGYTSLSGNKQTKIKTTI